MLLWGNGHQTRKQQALTFFLRGKAENWYFTSLYDVTRAVLKTNLQFWIDKLEARFRKPAGFAFEILKQTRYTVRDVRTKRDPIEYVNVIIYAAKHAGNSHSPYYLMMICWQHLELVLHTEVLRPREETHLNSIITYHKPENSGLACIG